jgi:hypothetical protein
MLPQIIHIVYVVASSGFAGNPEGRSKTVNRALRQRSVFFRKTFERAFLFPLHTGKQFPHFIIHCGTPKKKYSFL